MAINVRHHRRISSLARQLANGLRFSETMKTIPLSARRIPKIINNEHLIRYKLPSVFVMCLKLDSVWLSVLERFKERTGEQNKNTSAQTSVIKIVRRVIGVTRSWRRISDSSRKHHCSTEPRLLRFRDFHIPAIGSVLARVPSDLAGDYLIRLRGVAKWRKRTQSVYPDIRHSDDTVSARRVHFKRADIT